MADNDEERLQPIQVYPTHYFQHPVIPNDSESDEEILPQPQSFNTNYKSYDWNYDNRDVFRLFRHLEQALPAGTSFTVQETIARSPDNLDAGTLMGSRLDVLVTPDILPDYPEIDAGADPLRPHLQTSDNIQSATIGALVDTLTKPHSPWPYRAVPLFDITRSEYPVYWLENLLSQLQEQNVRLHHHVVYLDLYEISNLENYESVYNHYVRQLEAILNYCFRRGICHLAEADALKWQCARVTHWGTMDDFNREEDIFNVVTATTPNLYQLQRWQLVPRPLSFLYDRLMGRDYLFAAPGNLYLRVVLSKFLLSRQESVVFCRGFVAITLRSHNDYDIISECQVLLAAAAGRAAIGEHPQAVTYYLLGPNSELLPQRAYIVS